MEITKQVCSLELAKRLKELGVKQESPFAWYPTSSTGGIEWHISTWGDAMNYGDDLLRSQQVSAFTVAELGEMLPSYILPKDGGTIDLYTAKFEVSWDIGYRDRDWVVIRKYGKTEADARAKMLVYLLENKIITLSK